MLTESIDSFYLLLTPPLSYPNFGVFSLDQVTHLGVNVSKDLKLFGRKIIFELCQPMWSQYLIVTDGQKDGQKDRRTADIQSHNRALRSITW